METKSLRILFLLAKLVTVFTLDKCFDPELCDDINLMTLKADFNDDEIKLAWLFNSSETFYGFQVKIFDGDDLIIYESPILHILTTNMNFKTELPNGNNYVCLQVLYNSTSVITEKCEDLKVSDLKIIIGILAGTIFLVPCVIILGVFIYKDKKIRKSMVEYHKSNVEYRKFASGHRNDSYVADEAKASTRTKYQSFQTNQNVFKIPSSEEDKRKKNMRTVMEIIIEDPVIDINTKPENGNNTFQDSSSETSSSKEQNSQDEIIIERVPSKTSSSKEQYSQKNNNLPDNLAEETIENNLSIKDLKQEVILQSKENTVDQEILVEGDLPANDTMSDVDKSKSCVTL